MMVSTLEMRLLYFLCAQGSGLGSPDLNVTAHSHTAVALQPTKFWSLK